MRLRQILRQHQRIAIRVIERRSAHHAFDLHRLAVKADPGGLHLVACGFDIWRAKHGNGIARRRIALLAKSKGEARRLVQQGGAYINGEPVGSIEVMVSTEHVQDGAVLLRFGKKKFHRVVVE